jgi:glycosyltransferase involved in cell wall biosynthesis
MRIMVDTRWIFKEFSGIGFYTRELLRQMVRQQPESDFVLLFCDEEIERRILSLPELAGASNVEVVRVSGSVFSFKSQVTLPKLIRNRSVDVFFSPNWMVPYLAFLKKAPDACKLVVTIHDLIPLARPGHAPKALKSRLFFIFKWLMKRTARCADGILTPSEHSRSDVFQYLGVPISNSAKVAAIPEAAAEEYVPGAGPRTKPPELLYVGRFDPYKNAVLLIRAFKKVADQHAEVRLRIIGSPDPRYPEAADLANELGVNDRITWQGYADSADLLRAYQTATALVFPSSYEGFGLPILEAMACATPVICSPVSSIPEAAGDAALMFTPDDADDLAEKILEMLTEPRLAQEYGRKGLERAKQFTWAKTAAETFNFLGQTLKI